MANNHEPIWPGGTYRSVTAPLDPSLIELAVQSSGQSIKRVCASHLHCLHSNLSQDQLLALICQDCPVRSYLVNQAQRLQSAGDTPESVTMEPVTGPGAGMSATCSQMF